MSLYGSERNILVRCRIFAFLNICIDIHLHRIHLDLTISTCVRVLMFISKNGIKMDNVPLVVLLWFCYVLRKCYFNPYGFTYQEITIFTPKNYGLHSRQNFTEGNWCSFQKRQILRINNITKLPCLQVSVSDKILRLVT